jgi:hypothetical protein
MGRSFYGCSIFRLNGPPESSCNFTHRDHGLVPFGELLNFIADQRADARAVFDAFRYELPSLLQGARVYPKQAVETAMPSPYPRGDSGVGIPVITQWCANWWTQVEEVSRGGLNRHYRNGKY